MFEKKQSSAADFVSHSQEPIDIILPFLIASTSSMRGSLH